MPRARYHISCSPLVRWRRSIRSRTAPSSLHWPLGPYSSKSRSTELVGDEAVADPRNRVDVVRLFRVALDLLAQAVDVGVDRTRLDLDLVAPHFAQELAAAHHLAGLRGQQRQEVELGERQGDLFPLAPHLAAVHIDDEAGELEARLGLCLRDRLLAPTQVCAHPG